MDQVKIRAAIAAHGLKKDTEVTVAATSIVEGAISNGVFVELERYPSPGFPEEAVPDDVPKVTEPQDGVDDETPVPPVEDVQLPDAPPEDQPDEPAPKPKSTARRRG